jgi:DNA replicative helicase MCM subunit Mcm2 (Cdc46/Mcm family)
MENSTILTILKTDLQISVDAYDDLLNKYILLAKKNIETEGIKLTESAEDGMLVETYAAWLARKRKENVPMSRMLRYMLNNRLLSEKMKTKED